MSQQENDWSLQDSCDKRDPTWLTAPLADLERSFLNDDPVVPTIVANVNHSAGVAPCQQRCAGNVSGPHKCIWNGKKLTISCTTCPKVYRRKSDFNRHYRTVHNKTVYTCPFPGCNSVFSRLDNVNPHRRAIHGEYIPEKRVAPPGRKKPRARMQEAARAAHMVS